MNAYGFSAWWLDVFRDRRDDMFAVWHGTFLYDDMGSSLWVLA